MAGRVNLREKAGALRGFIAENRRVPSYTEMLSLFGYRSKNAVFHALSRLEEEGYITKEDGRIGYTGKLMGNMKLLGSVQAGFPSPAEEELLDTISLDEFLVQRPDATFMLKVTGDSMIDAGIQPGDMVLVEKGTRPKNNDIIVAQVDGEWTMKYFVKDRQGVRLEAANRKYEPIRPRNSLEIGGVVRTVIRKYS